MFVGGLFGGLMMFLLTYAYSVSDNAISQTFHCDRLVREAECRQSAKSIIEQFLLNVTAQELENVISAAGLQLDRFEK